MFDVVGWIDDEVVLQLDAVDPKLADVVPWLSDDDSWLSDVTPWLVVVVPSVFVVGEIDVCKSVVASCPVVPGKLVVYEDVASVVDEDVASVVDDDAKDTSVPFKLTIAVDELAVVSGAVVDWKVVAELPRTSAWVDVLFAGTVVAVKPRRRRFRILN